jgi:hypothetical protein
MTGPFPDTITPPVGLIKPRIKMGLPPWAWSAAMVGVVVPIVLIGRWGLLVSGLTLVVGMWLAYECHWDPNFLSTWIAEMNLKRVYR